jgi:hypothetical protein
MTLQRFSLTALAGILAACLGFQSPPAYSQQLIEPDWFVEGNQDFGSFARDVDGAGDVNGDGYADIVIGWGAYSGELRHQGVVLVYHGGRFGPAETPDWRFEGPHASSYVGTVVAGVGDVNNDGYDDVLVTVDNLSETVWSAVFLFLGGAEGLSSTPDWIGTPFGKNQGYYGASIAGGGDVNGDGYDDILVGDPGYDDDSTPDDEGRVYIYFGGRRGIHPRRPLIFDGSGSLGRGLAFAGDVNGDGFDDVVMGEPHYNYINNGSGRALVHYGFRGGVRKRPAWTFALDQYRWSDLGYEVSGAGDINGDGFDDIVVGQPYFFGGGFLCQNPFAGRAYVFHGGPGGLAERPDLIIEQPYSGCNDIGFGASLDAAGDVNGDDMDDALIGWWAGNSDGYDRGTGFIHHGANGGITGAPDRFFNNRGAGTLAGAGDVNGDGFDDVLTGYSGHSNAYGHFVGSASLYFGGRSKSEGDRSANRPVVLHPNHPNPFNPVTTVRFELERALRVRIDIFDIRGRRLMTLADRAFSAGLHSVVWNGTNTAGVPVASGIYFVRLNAADQVLTRRALLLK